MPLMLPGSSFMCLMRHLVDGWEIVVWSIQYKVNAAERILHHG